MMVSDPVHCKAVTDTLLDYYGIYVQPHQLSDRAAGHRAHAAHTLAGAHRRADGGVDREELWARSPVANNQ
jgi:5-aminolevulinate synthase